MEAHSSASHLASPDFLICGTTIITVLCIMTSPSAVEEGARENGLKRRRVSVACANCRARKSRVGQPRFLLCLLDYEKRYTTEILKSVMVRVLNAAPAQIADMTAFMNSLKGRVFLLTESQPGNLRESIHRPGWPANFSYLLQLDHCS